MLLNSGIRPARIVERHGGGDRLVDVAAVGQLRALGADVADAQADVARDLALQRERVLLRVAVEQIRSDGAQRQRARRARRWRTDWPA